MAERWAGGCLAGPFLPPGPRRSALRPHPRCDGGKNGGTALEREARRLVEGNGNLRSEGEKQKTSTTNSRKMLRFSHPNTHVNLLRWAHEVHTCNRQGRPWPEPCDGQLCNTGSENKGG